MSYFKFLTQNLRWLAGGFLLSFFSSFGQTYFVALSTGPIRAAFDLTSGEYGTLYMVATLVSALALPFLGQIVDRYSVSAVSSFTILMLALACFVVAYAQSIWLLIAAMFGLRLFGQGMMSHVALTAMGKWYEENRGKAVSIASLGFSAGQALLPLAFVGLVSFLDWRLGWVVAGVVLVVVALPAIAALMRVERIPRGTASEPTVEKGRQWQRSEVLRDPLFWLTATGILAPPFIGTAIFFHQDHLLVQRGWTLELFAFGMVIMTVVSVISGLLAGAAVDRASAISMLPLFLLPLGAGCLSLALVSGPIALLIFMALLGISMGISLAIFGSLWPEAYGTRHLGSIRSFIMALMVLFSALGPGVMGWLIDAGVPLTTQFFMMGAYCLAAAALLAVSSVKFKRRLAVELF